MSTNPISTQFPSNPIIMQQTPLMTFQPQMDLSQNMMGSTMAQPAMIQPMINPNNEIDPSKFFYLK
jgi:hypothetical protein